jgi:hypothetical protein
MQRAKLDHSFVAPDLTGQPAARDCGHKPSSTLVSSVCAYAGMAAHHRRIQTTSSTGSGLDNCWRRYHKIISSSMDSIVVRHNLGISFQGEINDEVCRSGLFIVGHWYLVLFLPGSHHRQLPSLLPVGLQNTSAALFNSPYKHGLPQ